MSEEIRYVEKLLQQRREKKAANPCTRKALQELQLKRQLFAININRDSGSMYKH